MLFECETYNEKRKCEWEKVEIAIPYPMYHSLNNMTTAERSRFILSGMNANYILEFYHVYDALLNFVIDMYSEYQACETKQEKKAFKQLACVLYKCHILM